MALREEMIRRYIRELSFSFGGVKPTVPLDVHKKLHREGHIAELVAVMKRSMNLYGMRIRLALVNSGGPKGAVAWVRMDDGGFVFRRIPHYGSKEFRESTVILYIRKKFMNEASVEAIVAVIAHELSHIIMDAIRHPLMLHEEAVDLAAMILGYRNAYFVGPGHFYLSPEEVRFAADIMKHSFVATS